MKMKFGKVSLLPNEEMKEHSNGGSEELLVIVEGAALVIFGGSENTVRKGEHILIPKETRHSVRNKGKEKLEYYYILPDRN